jgi:hypothetical protein
MSVCLYSDSCFYGYETQCHALREEHELQVFRHKVFRKIFRSKKDDSNSSEYYIRRNIAVYTDHLVLLIY